MHPWIFKGNDTKCLACIANHNAETVHIHTNLYGKVETLVMYQSWDKTDKTGMCEHLSISISQPVDFKCHSRWEVREFVKPSSIDGNRDCQFLLNFIPCVYDFVILLLGKNKHVTEGHLTLFFNTFPNFSQSISNNHDFFLHDTQALP